jgi:hypothetical protein
VLEGEGAAAARDIGFGVNGEDAYDAEQLEKGWMKTGAGEEDSETGRLSVGSAGRVEKRRN